MINPTINVEAIIGENKERLAKLNAPYNPLTGEGSPLPRTQVKLEDMDVPLYLVNTMVEEQWILALLEAGSFKAFAEMTNSRVEDIQEMFVQERFRHDFEFWAVLCIIIQDKLTLQDVPFILRKAQLILLTKLEKMRMAGRPIRVILLKARQWGGSTLVQFYMMWIQQIHKTNWHLAVCAQDDGASKNIGEMYQRASTFYPGAVASISFKPYAKSPKNLVNVERGGIIGVGSINNPDQFRSYNYPMVHISEAGIWQDTPKRTASQLVQSLRSTVPRVAYSMVIIESTAKGVGNFFHREWLAASKKESGYSAVFVPWFKIDMYQTSMTEEEYPEFIATMAEHDWFAWRNGATLEGIKWYNEFQRDEKYEDSQMYEEFPTTPEEAFISTGSRVIPYVYINNARTTILKPRYRGDLFPSGFADKRALENMEFHENHSGAGNLKIWNLPEPYITVRGQKFTVTNRYCGFADIGGISAKADYSCIKIIDRKWMLWGGVPETAAIWHGHCFVPQTKVYTSKGFKNIEDVEVGDLVWTHKNRFRKVLKTYVKEYDGDLIAMRSQGNYETVKCTPEHPFYSNNVTKEKTRRKYVYNGRISYGYPYTEKIGEPSWVGAKDLKYVAYSKTRDAATATPFVIDKYNGGRSKNTEHKINDLESLFSVMGYYLAEGHIDYRRENKSIPSKVVFSFGYHEKATVVNDCVERLEKLGFNPSVKDSEKVGVCRVIVSNTFFASLLLELCGEHSWEKMINPRILGYSKELLQTLLISYWKGDGTTCTTNESISNSTSTVSPILARQIRDILILLGHRPGVYSFSAKTLGANIKSGRTRYNVVWTVSERKKSVFMQDSDNIAYKLKTKTVEQYSGKVHNLEVEEDNSYSTESYIVHNCDQDLFSWKCAQLGTWYNNMLLAIEANSLRKEKTEGDYFVTVLDNIAPHYDNLFIRNNHEAINKDYIPKYGFQTGQGNKQMIVTSLLGVFRGDVNGHPLYNERDEDTLDECDWYEKKPDGSMGAVEGKKDDRVIITAGSVWLATKYLPPPMLVPYVDSKDRKKIGRTIISEASI